MAAERIRQRPDVRPRADVEVDARDALVVGEEVQPVPCITRVGIWTATPCRWSR